MTRSLLGAALLLTFTVAIGCGGNNPEARADDVLLLSGDVDDGEEKYLSLCETCHEVDGMGADAFPDIGEYLGQRPDSDFIVVMIEGPGGMPAFEGQTDQALADLLAYAKATF